MTTDDDTFRMPGAASRSGTGASSVSDDELAPGARVGEYFIEKRLAAGGQGSIYLAEHRVLGRRAAVKVLHRDTSGSGETTARFVREARVVNMIRHPNIVDIYDIGTLPDGRSFCVMELLPGRSLSALLAERSPLQPAEAVAYLAPVCQALQAAHRAGVVHRDVKASNVMVLEEGAAPRVKLLDFGVAKVTDSGEGGLTTVGQRIGTLHSMAPEQILGGAVDPRTDVYGLGVLLHQMLTGHYPFASGDLAEVERMHLEATPPRPSAVAVVPPELDAVVARCLEKSPQRRWPSAAAVEEAARGALLEAPSAAALRSAAAVAIHVGLRPRDPADPGALGAQADAADSAEAALRDAGFALPLTSAGALLGVLLLPAEPAAARAVQAEAVALARDLATRLASSALEVSVGVHADEALVRDTSSGPEFSASPICETARWVPEQGVGFFATRQALLGCEPAGSGTR
jgi:hypothetical protein